jgi:hypothetical protein
MLCSPAFACTAADRLPRTNLLCYAKPDGSIAEVKTAADWQKRRAQILDGFQKITGPLPGKEKRVPLDVKTEETEVDGGDYGGGAKLRRSFERRRFRSRGVNETGLESPA